MLPFTKTIPDLPPSPPAPCPFSCGGRGEFGGSGFYTPRLKAGATTDKLLRSFLGVAILTLHSLLFAFPCSAQQSDKRFTLARVLELSRQNSPDARQALAEYRSAYWAYRSYRAGLKPQVRLQGVLPEYYSSIDRITQEDGTFQFRERRVATNSVTLAVDQVVPLTGGVISVQSQLQRIDDFRNKNSTYQTNPVLLSLYQPLLQYNDQRWQQRIQPVSMDVSRRWYNRRMEQVAIGAAEKFFQLLLAQTSLELARTNLNGSDTLLQMAQGRFEVGRIGEDELLQVRLAVLEARRSLAEQGMEQERLSAELAYMIGVNDTVLIRLVEPSLPVSFEISEMKVLAQTEAGKYQQLEWQLRKLQADRAVAQARQSNGLTASLNGTFGLTKANRDLAAAYQSPFDQQQTLNLSFNLPLMAWGRQQARLRSAEATREQTIYQLEAEQKNYRASVRAVVRRLQLDLARADVANLARDIALRRFQISTNRFRVGKVDVTALNIARQEKDQAARGWQQALQAHWMDYLRLREMTLFDFASNQAIEHPANVQ